MTAVDRAEALYRQGDAAHDARDFAQAERLLRAALEADPSHWLARYTLAVVLQDTGRHAQAIPLYTQAVAERPTHLKAWNNFGVALQYGGDRERAVEAFRQALRIEPAHPGALANLSGLLAELGAVDEARDVLAHHCNPEAPNVLDLRRALMLPPVAGSASEVVRRRATMLAELRRLAERPPRLSDPLREVGRTPFYLPYQPESDREILETLATVYRRACPELAFVAPQCRPESRRPPRSGRQRIGFASFFFYEHSVGRVIHGLVRDLPRDRFEVVVVFLGGREGDPLAGAIAAAADRVVETAYDLAASRTAIAALELDVLCLTDFGMDPLAYFLGFARLAPVQCTTWGHAESSGIDTVDWFVSTEGFERADGDDDYTERLHRLPGVASPAVYARPRAQAGGTSRIEPGPGPNYVCTQTVYKLHPDFDPLLAQILGADPAARLYLFRAAEPRWNAQIEARLQRSLGPAAAQLRWLDTLARADYEATLASADVVLDPPHFTGGNTSLEAFALHKPIVTLRGRTMRARFTSAFYAAMGLAQLAATDPGDYVRKAIQWGADRAIREDLARQIGARCEVLFDDPRVPTAWADFFDRALAARAGA